MGCKESRCKMDVAASSLKYLGNLKNQLRVILRSAGKDANEKTKAANRSF